MTRFVLAHRHEPAECAVAFAAWRGFDSTLRHTGALGTCRLGGHELWFVVEADDEARALALLPPWLAARARACPVDELPIP